MQLVELSKAPLYASFMLFTQKCDTFIKNELKF